MNGTNIAKDPSRAMNWFIRSANSNNPEYQYRLSEIYASGTLGRTDLLEAYSWANKSAEQGYPQAQYLVGRMSYYGQGTPRNLSAAADYFLKAEEQKNADAQAALGLMFIKNELNDTLRKNPKVNFWIMVAAQKGIIEAVQYQRDHH